MARPAGGKVQRLSADEADAECPSGPAGPPPIGPNQSPHQHHVDSRRRRLQQLLPQLPGHRYRPPSPGEMVQPRRTAHFAGRICSGTVCWSRRLGRRPARNIFAGSCLAKNPRRFVFSTVWRHFQKTFVNEDHAGHAGFSIPYAAFSGRLSGQRSR
jgi:hypothetical protein